MLKFMAGMLQNHAAQQAQQATEFTAYYYKRLNAASTVKRQQVHLGNLKDRHANGKLTEADTRWLLNMAQTAIDLTSEKYQLTEN